jgi:hypothetical protein
MVMYMGRRNVSKNAHEVCVFYTHLGTSAFSLHAVNQPHPTRVSFGKRSVVVKPQLTIFNHKWANMTAICRPTPHYGAAFREEASGCGGELRYERGTVLNYLASFLAELQLSFGHDWHLSLPRIREHAMLKRQGTIECRQKFMPG